MTTPDTSTVRAWARSNGYDVADRGRLPAELTEAYLAAHGKGGGTASKKAAPAKKATPRKKAAPAKRTAARKAAAKAPSNAVAPQAVETHPATDPRPEPRPKPSPVNDDRRLVALAEQLAALTDRVAALEKAGGSSGSNGKPAGKRFRRSR